MTGSEQVHPHAFAFLDQQIFKPAWKAEAYVDGPDRLAVSVWQNEQCLGFVYGQQVLDEVELWRIATHPEHRRQGLGNRLLKAFNDLAISREAHKVFLEVASGNIAATNLYKAHGFKINGSRKGYYQDGSDALNMVLDLQSDTVTS